MKSNTVPVGPATIAGLVGAVATGAPVLIDLLADDRLTDGTRRLLIIAAVVLIALVIVCRTAQSIAQTLKLPKLPPVGAGEAVVGLRVRRNPPFTEPDDPEPGAGS